MGDASDETSDSLIRLFSVRSRSSQHTDQLQTPDSLKGLIDTEGSTSNQNQSTNKASMTPLPKINPQLPNTLNAKSAVLLREARKELGKDYSSRSGDLGTTLINEEAITSAIDKVLRKRGEVLSDIQRADLIVHLKKDLSGWGILQSLIDTPDITDIHVYDYKTVVLQRGKDSEQTSISWPSHQAYTAFIDRILLSLDRSLSTQQHTVDVALPNGIRICAIHESICGSGGPLLSIRIPRVMKASLETIVTYQMAPAPIIDYLGSLIHSGKVTMIIAGETGTGKTTLLRCLGTLFGPQESIVAVEDTPELNFQHPFVRSLIARPANMEGVGEVSLQEQIRSTLRMTPTRVVLGEMRTPLAAEAFLESAQTGHVGLSTLHARNAKETLVRLESLLGRAQKSVSVDIIRQQIALAVDVIVWLYREKGTGKPRIGEIIEVCHYVEGVIQTRPMFSFKNLNGRPTWTVDSWNSSFEEILASHGVFISRFPEALTFETTAFQKAAN